MSDDFEAITGDLGDFAQDAERKAEEGVYLAFTYTFAQIEKAVRDLRTASPRQADAYLVTIGLKFMTNLVAASLELGYCPSHGVFGEHDTTVDPHEQDDDEDKA